MMTCCQLDTHGHTWVKFRCKYNNFCTFQYVVCKISIILSQPQCVNQGIDHGREGVTAATPEWFVVRRRDVPRKQLEGRPRQTTNHEGVVAVTPSRPWSIRIITWLNNVVRQDTSKITTKSSDVAYLPPLWSHASLLNDGSCSFTHPVVKDRSARGTSSGT